jgi:SOS-response transcriptional repressor LexA
MDQLNPDDFPKAYDASQDTGTVVNVHAGFPNPAAERRGAPLSLDKLLVRHPSSTYFFRIRGHHWYDQGVFDGDLAIIDRAISPRAGDLVVSWQESGEFVLTPFAAEQRSNHWGTITAVVHPYGPAAPNLQTETDGES